MKLLRTTKAAAAATLAAVATLTPEAIAVELEEGRPSSIYELRPLLDGVLTGVAGIAGGLPYLFSDTLVELSCPCDPARVNPFDRQVIGKKSQFFGQVSNVSLGVALVVPAVVDYFVLDDRWVWLEDTVVFVETQAITFALTTAVKFTLQRPQPTVYDPGGRAARESWNYLSFFSGHTSAVFAALATSSYTVGQRYGIWALPYLVTAAYGAGVGTSLVLSGGHFPTDLIGGVVAGTLVGTVVPWLHLRRHRRVTLLPWRSTSGGGIALRGPM